MQNQPIVMSVPSIKTNVSVAGKGSSARGSDLRDMRASLACRHEGHMKEDLHVPTARSSEAPSRPPRNAPSNARAVAISMR